MNASPSPPILRLLYVEDNPVNAMLFVAALSLRGNIDVRIAEDDTQALALLADWQPDVLVLDAHLPGMDGFELLGALRGRPGMRDVPAFMCSADASDDHVARAALAGFRGYWAKPIDISTILHDLDRVRAALPGAAGATGPRA